MFQNTQETEEMVLNCLVNQGFPREPFLIVFNGQRFSLNSPEWQQIIEHSTPTTPSMVTYHKLR